MSDQSWTRWEELEAKRTVRPTFTGVQASAVLAAIESAADDAAADGDARVARVLRNAARAIQNEA